MISLNNKTRLYFNQYFFAFLIIFIVILILFLNKKFPEVKKDRSAILKQIQRLARLETVSFTFEKIIDTGTKGNKLEELFFGDKILLIAHGEVVAGVDLSAIPKDNIQIKNKMVTLILPQPTIFSVYLDNSKTRVYDRKKGILNFGTKDLESEARLTAEKEIRKAACESDILNEANKKAELFFQQFFSSFGYEEIKIITKAGQCD